MTNENNKHLTISLDTYDDYLNYCRINKVNNIKSLTDKIITNWLIKNVKK